MVPKKPVYQFRLQLQEEELHMLVGLAETRNLNLMELLRSLIREAHHRERTRVEGQLEAYADRLESAGSEDEARRIRAAVEKLKGSPGVRRRRLFQSSPGSRSR